MITLNEMIMCGNNVTNMAFQLALWWIWDKDVPQVRYYPLLLSFPLYYFLFPVMWVIKTSHTGAVDVILLKTT